MLPVLTRREVRRDLRKLLGGLDPSYTLDAAAKLAKWDRPTLIAWSENDRFFPPEHGERLAKLIPDARHEVIEGARTFSAEDKPERLAELIGASCASGDPGRVTAATGPARISGAPARHQRGSGARAPVAAVARQPISSAARPASPGPARRPRTWSRGRSSCRRSPGR